MIPSNSRKRSIGNSVADEANSREQSTPHKKRYTLAANSIHSASKATQTGVCTLEPPTYGNGDHVEPQLDKSTVTTATTGTSGWMSGNNLFNMSDSTPVDTMNKMNSRLRESVSVTSVLKFPTVQSTARQTASSEPISIASTLNYPATLIPLTAEERKMFTIQQLIAEKLRMMRRDKLVLLKSPAPNPNESEICLTVVEVCHSEESSDASTPMNYAVLQEDIDDSSELFKLVLDKINKKSIPKATENPGFISLPALEKSNVEYARQIEREVMETITAFRQKTTVQSNCISAPIKDNHAIYVLLVDREEIKEDKEPAKAPVADISENDRREQQFTEIFDTIFQKLSTESKKRKALKSLEESEQTTKKAKALERQQEDEERRNKAMKGSDYRRENVKSYPSTTLDDLDAVTIGPNGTKISIGGFLKINWWQWPTGYCTRKLLPQVFNKATLSSHSLWGANSDNKTLSPDKVDDLVYLISDNKAGATVKDVHQAIVSKCYSHKIQNRCPKPQETTN